jgi:putative nucleotidyltransferase with HDIG domain
MVALGLDTMPRLLYVDDEKPMLHVVRRTLRDRVDLDTTHDPAEAIDLIRSSRYHIVMTDLRMPEHDGIDVLRAARASQQESLRILVSGAGDFHAALEAINGVGVFRFIQKPWQSCDLIAAIDAALELISVRRDNERIRRLLEQRNRELQNMNARLDELVAERTASALRGLISAVDLRDTETSCHSRRAALYARRLAEELGLDANECLEIERGALLHDVGKIGVSDTILRKAGPLTEGEWVEMRKHPLYGASILERVTFLGRGRLVVQQHHEHWNGAGYPHGLCGDDIYIGARIFAVIDTYDAITSDRPYRRRADHETAMAEIRRCSGTQFDPTVVAAFERIDAAELAHIRGICARSEDEGLV